MFVQIIEGHTDDAEGLSRQLDRWRAELRPGATGYLGTTSGVTADGRSIALVRFESEAAARANSERTEQGTWWAETEKYFVGDVAFAESSDITEWLRGGSNDAGFVQVMKSTDVDRATIEQLDAAFETMTDFRPDVIGGYRVWTGDRSCTEVAYFTSEDAARAGEKAELPAKMQELFSQMQDAQGEVEYFDLVDPDLF